MEIKTIVGIIIIICIVFVVFQIYNTNHLIQIGLELAKSADKTKYSQSPKNSTITILMIGDSTVVGTGAKKAGESLAGLVGQTFPHAKIVNRGINGRKTKSLRKEIEKLEESYDLIMLHTGGNDIVRFTDLNYLEKDLHKLLVAAKKKSKKVVLTTSGNVGTSLLLPQGTRWLFTKRTRKVRALFMRVSRDHNVSYVDLFREPNVDPFFIEPDKYYAADYFHPNSKGYALWYERIEPVLKKNVK